MSGRRAWTIVAALAVAALFVAAATAGSEATTAGSYKQVGKWGKVGTGNGQFGSNAYGLATDKSGRVYVADSDNHRIQIFSASGGFQGKISFDSGSSVQDVVVDSDGNVWSSENQAGRVQRFTRGGNPLTSLDLPKLGLGIGVDADGNVYAATAGDNVYQVVRFDRSGTSWQSAKTWGGFQSPHDVEVSADGTIYVSDTRALNVKRFTKDGKLLKTFKAGPSAPIGIGMDPDCNLWVGNISQRRLDRFSPSGRLLGSVSGTDLIAQDVAIGPKGDVYAYDGGTHSVVRFAEDRSKPATANVAGTITVAGGTAKIAYTLGGVACPSVVNATATLTGPGIAGKAAGLKLKAGAKNTIQMKLSRAGSGKATFRIVLKTNGRPTTETRSVTVVSR